MFGYSQGRPFKRVRHGYVDGEGDVVAEFVPGRVGAEFDVVDLGGPGLGEEDEVDVAGAIFVVVEVVGWVSWPWDSEKKWW